MALNILKYLVLLVFLFSAVSASPLVHPVSLVKRDPVVCTICAVSGVTTTGVCSLQSITAWDCSYSNNMNKGCTRNCVNCSLTCNGDSTFAWSCDCK